MKIVVFCVLTMVFIALGCNQKSEPLHKDFYKQIIASDPLIDHVVQDIDTGAIYRVGPQGELVEMVQPAAGKLRGFDLQDSLLAWCSDSSAVTVLNLHTKKQRVISVDKDIKVHHDMKLHYPFLTALYKSSKMKDFNKNYQVVDDGLIKMDLRDGSKTFWSITDFFDTTWPDTLQRQSKVLNPHSNCVEVDQDGNFYISYRDISQVWKISSDFSNVIYRVGDKSSYKMIAEKDMIGQHSVEIVRPDEFFLYDNGSNGRQEVHSRIVRVLVDTKAQTYKIKTILNLNDTLRTIRMGSVQALGDRLSISVFNMGFHLLEIDTTGKLHNHLFNKTTHSLKSIPLHSDR